MIKAKDYGAGDRLDANSFPEALAPEYFEAWAAYIETQTAQDLFNSGKNGMLYAVQGFISYLNRTVSKPQLRNIPGVSATSLERYKSFLKTRYREVNEFYARMLVRRNLRVADVRSRINSIYNPVANCIVVTAEVYMTFIPISARQKIGEILNSNKQLWFSGKSHASVFKTDNLTKLLAKSAQQNVPDTYPSLVSVIGKRDYMAEWNPSLGMDCCRTKGNSFTVRIRLEHQIFFLGKHKQSEVERLINRGIKQVFV